MRYVTSELFRSQFDSEIGHRCLLHLKNDEVNYAMSGSVSTPVLARQLGPPVSLGYRRLELGASGESTTLRGEVRQLQIP